MTGGGDPDMPVPEMKYCMQCGTKLIMRYHEGEKKEIAFCEGCKDFRFPVFNTAVSMVVTNESEDRILLIKQYGRDRYILVAGYINKGEEAEHAVAMEVREETGLTVSRVQFNHSHYYARSNTLLLNFTAVVDGMNVHENSEIDSYRWFTREETRKNVSKPSLAGDFLEGYLTGKYHFTDNYSYN
jgi:NAD+ diphosphatase